MIAEAVKALQEARPDCEQETADRFFLAKGLMAMTGIEIHPGAGASGAGLVSMLLRASYSRWAEVTRGPAGDHRSDGEAVSNRQPLRVSGRYVLMAG